MMQCMLNTLDARVGAGLNPEWVDHLERSAVDFLLKHQPDRMPAGSPQAGPGAKGVKGLSSQDGCSRIEAVCDFMHARLAAPISVLDLARAGGISVRTLNLLCRRHFGLPPMEVLRNIRLDAVRARLQLQPEANITHVALDYGFGHPGRLAAYYRDRFSELPRETQGRCLDSQGGD